MHDPRFLHDPAIGLQFLYAVPAAKIVVIPAMEVFVPFNEATIEKLGFDIGRLVPFRLEYQCLHVDVDELDAEPVFEVLLKDTA